MDSYTTVIETSASIELIKGITQFLTACIFPALILIIVLIFKKQIAGFLEKIKKAKTPLGEYETNAEEELLGEQIDDTKKTGIEVKVLSGLPNELLKKEDAPELIESDDHFQQVDTTVEPRNVKTQFDDFFDLVSPYTIELTVEEIRNEFKADFSNKTYGNGLFNYLVYIRASKSFDVIYSEIYFIQFAMLFMIFRKEQVSLFYLKSLYKQSRSNPKDEKFDKYISFLTINNLIKIDSRNIVNITEYGFDFFNYCVLSNKNWVFKLYKANQMIKDINPNYEDDIIIAADEFVSNLKSEN